MRNRPLPANDTGFVRPLGLALAIAVGLRAAALALRIDPLQNPDSLAFLGLARSFATSGHLAYVDQGAPGMVLQAFRSLLYPIFLAAFGATGPTLPPASPVLLVQSLLGVATIACVADLARVAFGARVGVVTAGIGAIYLGSIACERQITSEALFTPLLAGATWMLARFGNRTGIAILAGGTFALAGWVRPAGFVAGVGATVALIASTFAGNPRDGNTRVPWSVVAGLVVGMTLVAIPGLWRNAHVLGSPALLTSGGMNFWIGNGRGSVGDAWVVMAREGPRLGELGMDRWFYADTYAHAGEIVRGLPRSLVDKAIEFFTPTAREAWSIPYRLVWPVAFVGFAIAAFRHPRPAISSRAWPLLLGVVASQVVLAFATVPWSRYRFPIEALFWPLAALAIVRAVSARGIGRWLLSGVVLVNVAALLWQLMR